MKKKSELLPEHPELEIPIEYIRVDQIESNEYNPNEMDEAKFQGLKDTIKREGRMDQPVILRPLNEDEEYKREEGINYIIVDGEHRYLAVYELGYLTVPSIVRPLEMDDAKFKTVAMNNVRGKHVPLKMAKLIVDLMERHDIDTIRSMTGIEDEEMVKLQGLMDIPELNFDDSPTIGLDHVSQPISVNLLLMPDEHDDYDSAVRSAIELQNDAVVPLFGDEVIDYDDAMTTALGLAGVKLRNIGLAMVCRGFSMLTEDQLNELKIDTLENIKSKAKS